MKRPLITTPRELQIGINPKNYFIDYLQLNVKMPYKQFIGQELIDSKKILNQLEDRFNLDKNYKTEGIEKTIPSLLTKLREEKDYYWGLHFDFSRNQTKLHQFSIHFKGRFFSGSVNHRYIYEKYDKIGNPIKTSKKLVSYDSKNVCEPTRNVIEDIQRVYETWKILEQYIVQHIYNAWGDRPFNTTISRLDISTQMKSSLNKSVFKYNKQPWFQIKNPATMIFPFYHVGEETYTGFRATLGDENNQPSNRDICQLLVYDKNFTSQHESKNELSKLICLNRFGTNNVIRKEWKLKLPFIKQVTNKFNIKPDIEGLFDVTKNPKVYGCFWRALIQQFRRNKDCILYNDSHKYMAFHDPEFRKLVFRLGGWKNYEIERAYKRISPPRLSNMEVGRMAKKSNFQKVTLWHPLNVIKSTLSKEYEKFTDKEKEQLDKYFLNHLIKNKRIPNYSY